MDDTILLPSIPSVAYICYDINCKEQRDNVNFNVGDKIFMVHKLINNDNQLVFSSAELIIDGDEIINLNEYITLYPNNVVSFKAPYKCIEHSCAIRITSDFIDHIGTRRMLSSTTMMHGKQLQESNDNVGTDTYYLEIHVVDKSFILL